MRRDEQLPARDNEGFLGIVRERASESVRAWPTKPRPIQGSPNVVVMLMDDVGFSDIGPFGSEIDTPNLDRLAGGGYRFTNYHTPPMCAPARASLITGLNNHRVGFSFVPHIDPGFPHSTMEIPANVPTVAESFRAAGYATFMVGKWHLTGESRLHDGADKSSWPCQRGFDRYFGCMDGFTSLFHPHRLVSDNSQVSIDSFPEDYYLTDELTDRAMAMVTELRQSDPDKPFFLYFAHQAVHAPLQAKEADIAKYRGHYGAGWDEVRKARFARQLASGLFTEGTECAPRNAETGFDVAPWESLGVDERALLERYMEVYAAMVDNTDQNLGRLIRHLEEAGEFENTIFVFTSDNGASAEGGPGGTRSYFSQFTSSSLLPDDWESDVDRDPSLIGGPQTFVHYPRGWAYASNTPFRQYKMHTYAGGVHVPAIISWPAGLPRSADDDGVRRQFAHVTDIAPTMLDLAGVTRPKTWGGFPAPDQDGRSLRAVLESGSATAGQSRSQYFELVGRRAYIEGCWKALSPLRTGPGWEDDEWELYNLDVDPAETVNLANQHRDLLSELKQRWQAAAWMNSVFPLDDDGAMQLVRPSTELPMEEPVTLRPESPTLERYRSSKLINLRSFSIEVDLKFQDGDCGVLVAHGDQGGGYVLYIEDGFLQLSYNCYGRMFHIRTPLAVGTTAVGAKFTTLSHVRWRIGLMVNGAEVAVLEQVHQLIGMCPLTGISVGLERGGPVDWDLYRRHGCFRYRGNLRHVRYVPGPKAEYNREQIVDVMRRVELAFE
ncbi:arylsulfatase [Arthrobacter sulfonylureivorans]|uniref:arylsulfatase n=1 Tax=Arthrobacter sulfonylureivorans TaxID=2486855 RepID=UPI0039E31BE2